MEVSSWEGGSSPAAAAATATATAARKEESKLVQSPKAIPSKRRAGTPHSHQARPASDGGREGRKEREGERERKEGMYGHAWGCHPCHVMVCRVTATYAVGRVVDTSAGHVGASGGSMTWRDLALLW